MSASTSASAAVIDAPLVTTGDMQCTTSAQKSTVDLIHRKEEDMPWLGLSSADIIIPESALARMQVSIAPAPLHPLTDEEITSLLDAVGWSGDYGVRLMVEIISAAIHDLLTHGKDHVLWDGSAKENYDTVAKVIQFVTRQMKRLGYVYDGGHASLTFWSDYDTFARTLDRRYHVAQCRKVLEGCLSAYAAYLNSLDDSDGGDDVDNDDHFDKFVGETKEGKSKNNNAKNKNKLPLEKIKIKESAIQRLFQTAWEIPPKSLQDMAVDRGACIDHSQSSAQAIPVTEASPQDIATLDTLMAVDDAVRSVSCVYAWLHNRGSRGSNWFDLSTFLPTGTDIGLGLLVLSTREMLVYPEDAKDELWVQNCKPDYVIQLMSFVKSSPLSQSVEPKPKFTDIALMKALQIFVKQTPPLSKHETRKERTTPARGRPVPSSWKETENTPSVIYVFNALRDAGQAGATIRELENRAPDPNRVDVEFGLKRLYETGYLACVFDKAGELTFEGLLPGFGDSVRYQLEPQWLASDIPVSVPVPVPVPSASASKNANTSDSKTTSVQLSEFMKPYEKLMTERYLQTHSLSTRRNIQGITPSMVDDNDEMIHGASGGGGDPDDWFNAVNQEITTFGALQKKPTKAFAALEAKAKSVLEDHSKQLVDSDLPVEVQDGVARIVLAHSPPPTTMVSGLVSTTATATPS